MHYYKLPASKEDRIVRVHQNLPQMCIRDSTISIHEVFTIHYFEYMSDFSFAGESHNFWEFVFVDKGEIDIYMESIHARLKKGEVAFHKPNEFHRLQAVSYTHL